MNVGATAGLGRDVYTREVDYAAYDSDGNLIKRTEGAVIKEHLGIISGRKPPESQSKPGLPFFDQSSVGTTGDFILDQSFTIEMEGSAYEVRIQDFFGRQWGSNRVGTHAGYIDLNKNPNLGSGGKPILCN